MNNQKVFNYYLFLLLHWSPRVLGIIFAFFIGLFAMDIFSQSTGFLNTIMAFLLHLIPTLLIVIILALSWKKSWIGGLLFILLGFFYIIWLGKSVPGSPIIDITLFLVGILFFVDWILREKVKKAKAMYREEMQ